jgi:hypothetical protein
MEYTPELEEERWRQIEEHYALEEQWYLYKQQMEETKKTLLKLALEIGAHEWLLLVEEISNHVVNKEAEYRQQKTYTDVYQNPLSA